MISQCSVFRTLLIANLRQDRDILSRIKNPRQERASAGEDLKSETRNVSSRH